MGAARIVVSAELDGVGEMGFRSWRVGLMGFRALWESEDGSKRV